MATANVQTDTRTIHTLHITLPDDALARMENGDEVEVILSSRFGTSAPHRLSYRDRVRLTEDTRR